MSENLEIFIGIALFVVGIWVIARLIVNLIQKQSRGQFNWGKAAQWWIIGNLAIGFMWWRASAGAALGRGDDNFQALAILLSIVGPLALGFIQGRSGQ